MRTRIEIVGYVVIEMLQLIINNEMQQSGTKNKLNVGTPADGQHPSPNEFPGYGTKLSDVEALVLDI